MTNSIHLLNFSFRPKLPVILQTEVAECGLACLAMVANFHGHHFDLNGLRQRFHISSKGSTLNDLMAMADELKFVGRPLKLDLDELKELKIPAILHWDLGHFVVLKKVTDNHIIIHDPAVGERKLTLNDASNHFTGVALELRESEDFSQQEDIKKAKLSDFWARVVGLKRVLLQVFILSLILQLFSLASPFYTQIIVDDVIVSEDTGLLVILAVGFGLLMIIQTAVSFLRQLVILYLSTQIDIQMRSNLFRHLLKLPMNYFESRHLGDVVSRFGSLNNIKELLTTGVVTTVIDGIMSIGLLAMMFVYSPTLAFIVIAVSLLYLLIRLLAYPKYRQLNAEKIVVSAKESTNFMESIRGIQSIKLFAHEMQRLTLWQNYYANSVNAGLRVAKLDMGYDVVNSLLFGMENIIVIYLAATMVMDGDMSVGMLFAFMSYKGQFSGSVSSLIGRFIQFKMLSIHLERLGDIVLTEEEDLTTTVFNTDKLAGEVSINNLSFRYADNEAPIFENLSLTIKAKTSVAIVGTSGCGKTTLMKTMLGLLTPQSGKISIDGIDINKIGLRNYRDCIGTVMQDDQLLSGSIRENICFFSENNTEQDIIAAAQLAAIHDDIMAMPMGYQTLIGDMGNTLSGGQKQRLLLARALYKKPKILFLDEATSHLDVRLEEQINQIISKINITRIVIAHRPQTIAMADEVYRLQNGQLNKENAG